MFSIEFYKKIVLILSDTIVENINSTLTAEFDWSISKVNIQDFISGLFGFIQSEKS